MASVHLAGAWGAADLPALAVVATLSAGIGVVAGTACHGLVRSGWARILALLGLGVGFVIAVELTVAEGPWRPLDPSSLGLFGLFWLGAALSSHGPSAVESMDGGSAATWSMGLARAGAVCLLAWVLDGAAGAWGLVENGPPWSPGVAARLLDLSPRAFVMEVAGADWMRSTWIYEPVGTDRISPSLRLPYGPGGAPGPGRAVAVLPLIVVGSLLMGLRWKRAASLRATRSGASGVR